MDSAMWAKYLIGKSISSLIVVHVFVSDPYEQKQKSANSFMVMCLRRIMMLVL